MHHCYNYSIVRLEANAARGERLNLALAVFRQDGLTVRSGKNLDKVRAITGAMDYRVMEQALANLTTLDEFVRSQGEFPLEDRIRQIASLSAVSLSKPGQFFANDANSFEAAVSQLLAHLIDPEPAPPRVAKGKRTKLLTSIKSAFRSENILAKKGEDLTSHRVVVNERLAEGLTADLALKNGLMHIVQTVDASHIDRARRAIQEIGISALVFEQAKIRFGDNLTSPRLVYSANSQIENSIGDALHVAEHRGASLINWESHDDRLRFIDDISSLAEPTDAQRRVSFGAINVSTRKRLN